MTPHGEQLCYTDAYIRSVSATVRHVEVGDATVVVLDRTVFYPGGGGQPSDHGLLLRSADGRSWTVRAAKKVDGEIVHELEPDAGDPPAVGDAVQVDLEWARRLALMRTHTALHALCGVVWRDHGALVTGGNMEPGSGRMDFEFETMSGDLVDAIEARVNEELAAARDVRVAVLPGTRRSPSRTSSGPRSTCCRPASTRSGRSRSSGSTCRPTAARTSPTLARSVPSASPATNRRAGSTSGSGSRSTTRPDAPRRVRGVPPAARAAGGPPRAPRRRRAASSRCRRRLVPRAAVAPPRRPAPRRRRARCCRRPSPPSSRRPIRRHRTLPGRRGG